MRPSRGIRKSAKSATLAVGILAGLFSPVIAGAIEIDAKPIVVAANKAQTKTETVKVPKPAPTDPSVAALEEATARAKAGDYEAGRWHPIHFKPAIDKAKDGDCLTCHAEILKAKPREASEAGVPADKVLAWYQTLDTYVGGQEDFHIRHMATPYSGMVMNLSCTTCHQGNDPREESSHAELAALEKAGSKAPLPFTLRKMVDPSETCLKCHGQFPYQSMELPGPWHEIRADMEPEGTANGCLTCHETIRTNRHQVNYLKAAGIEEAAKENSDVCYGCHGGRSWYRISYPYPRTAWPDMPADTPEWAKGRPTEPEARFRLQAK